MIDRGETVLIGQWWTDGDRVVPDPICKRIELLVSNHLIELARSGDGWSTLLLDPVDGRLWERTFPQSQLHGGGPPALIHVSSEQALSSYGYEA